MLPLGSEFVNEAEPSRRRLVQAGAAFAATGGGKTDIVFRDGPVGHDKRS
ncbi:hypothetical protein [Bradyrhizobium aeschynomenes]|nr:hypothetical protein [Bradyrhizobium aeschynomenes]NPV21367.1 hypothetical protein [Bradyrhizobium aeschynomenes]